MSQDKLICSIYRSSKKDEMYLYVAKAKGLIEVPDALLKMFGKAQHSMDMLLTADKTLARADAVEILNAITEKGYYLQMPPARDEYLLDLYKAPVNPTY
ncbi:MAG: YcgL domain-containing protein [Gammaproteobacteria bacterium]|jgi:hypothetical protein|nr:YcgL domain-containing protein [Gammaproteobacteria bacterium]